MWMLYLYNVIWNVSYDILYDNVNALEDKTSKDWSKGSQFYRYACPATNGNDILHGWVILLYTPYISRGFYFREFRESGAIREFINTRKYLPPIPMHECDLCTQYIALLDREFNHSRKCLKVPIREKLDSRNIWRIQYFTSIKAIV